MNGKQALQPVGDRAVVQRLEHEELSPGGLILPDAVKKRNETAMVIAISESLTIPVKVGDRVILDKFSGQEVTIGDETFLILSSEAILAVMD